MARLNTTVVHAATTSGAIDSGSPVSKDGPARWLVFGAATVIVIARSAVLVFWEHSYFEANQAVIGLMAKHIVDGRAFPLFMYGQSYMLGVEAWMAAPLFLIAGPSVTALKLPLLAINLTVTWLLLSILQREVGLRPAAAGVAAIFFVLPSPSTASKLLEASGGLLEPFLYVLLIWLTKRRPVWCGVIVAVGFLHREFSIYGLASLLMLDLGRASLLTRSGVRRTLTMLSAAVAVWLVIQGVKPYSPAMGPGTTWAALPQSRGSVSSIDRRFCFEWRTVPGSCVKLVTVHWPQLFGTRVQHLSEYGINSRSIQGMGGIGLLLGGAMALAAVRIASHLARERHWHIEYDFCAYLVLVGVLSLSVYVFGRCGVINTHGIRYELLSILGAVGLAAWYLRVEESRALTIAWIALILPWAAVTAAAHSRFWLEYRYDPPLAENRLIARRLEGRGIRYALADYWIAYPVTFLSNEHVIVASTTRVRIGLYQREVAEHLAEAVRVSRKRCANGTPVGPYKYLCPP
jgi:DNA-binding transcriptional ArsR family regulator